MAITNNYSDPTGIGNRNLLKGGPKFTYQTRTLAGAAQPVNLLSKLSGISGAPARLGVQGTLSESNTNKYALIFSTFPPIYKTSIGATSDLSPVMRSYPPIR